MSPPAALATDAASPLGLAAVRALLEQTTGPVLAAAPEPARLPGLVDLAAEYPGRVQPVRADVRTPEGRAALAAAVQQPLALLVCGGTDPQGPALTDQHANRTLAELDAGRFAATVSGSAFTLLATVAALRPRLRGARILALGDWRGSLADRRDGGDYGIACAFAALHMAARTLAFDLEADDVIVAVGNPGLYRTALHGPAFQQHPVEVLRGLLRALEALPDSATGSFLDATGTVRHW